MGDNSLTATLIGSVVGALFYFATLTEVPITQALMEHGMAQGPALALLLAGPALSLPNMLVLIKVMGAKKTAAFCLIIVVVATATGMTFFTELTSNLASVNMILPVLAGASDELQTNPRLLMIPATLAASCAFMLPAATPPNAIVYGSGRLRMADMIRAGIVLNFPTV